MGRGFYLLHRGWRDNPVFKNERMTEREAWVWLIESANFKEGTFYFNQKPYKIRRGQLATTMRTLMKVARWSQQRVSGFLRKLKNEGMITTPAGTPFTLIQLENYDKYQLTPDTRIDTSTDTKLTSNQMKEVMNEKEENTNHSVPPPEWLNEQTWQAFVEHRKRIRKPMTPKAMELTLRELEKLQAQGEEPVAVLEQSIQNGWAGVFSIKKENGYGQKNRGNSERKSATQTIAEQIARIE